MILLAHGDGGLLTSRLIKDLFCSYFGNEKLDLLMDSAIFEAQKARVAITTDSFVITPLFFAGGDIGKLAVYGTVNDLAVCGAYPKYLAASFILEEGLQLSTLEQIVHSMSRACAEAGVQIIAGDTKVVERGNADKLFITTTGFGYIPEKVNMGYHRIQPGDLVVINGELGDHGIAIIAERHKLDLDMQIMSDCAPLNSITCEILSSFQEIKFMRDLTRGGFATALKEIALAAGVDIEIQENELPINPRVEEIAKVLGLDPMYLANEGKFLAMVAESQAGSLLELLHNHPLGRLAKVVGVVKEGKGDVFLKTPLGGTRELNLMTGIPLPRIC